MKKTFFAVGFSLCLLVWLMVVVSRGIVPDNRPVPEEEIFITAYYYDKDVELEGKDGTIQLYQWEGEKLPRIFIIRNEVVYPITEEVLNLPPKFTEADFKK